VDTLSLSRASPYRRTRGAATTKKINRRFLSPENKEKINKKLENLLLAHRRKMSRFSFTSKKKYKNVT
jgi:hypothetical protein